MKTERAVILASVIEKFFMTSDILRKIRGDFIFETNQQQ